MTVPFDIFEYIIIFVDISDYTNLKNIVHDKEYRELLKQNFNLIMDKSYKSFCSVLSQPNVQNLNTNSVKLACILRNELKLYKSMDPGFISNCLKKQVSKNTNTCDKDILDVVQCMWKKFYIRNGSEYTRYSAIGKDQSFLFNVVMNLYH